MNNPAIVAENIHKIFNDGTGQTITVLNGANCIIKRGEVVAIIGASGSGKSTLLQILGAVDHPNTGKVWVNGQCVQEMSEKERCTMRNRDLGYVYQFHHLLPEFTALENVAMPLRIAHSNKQKAENAALTILERLGLKARSHHLPSQLSGGERQRTAIARALVMNPTCLLADEPTGNLDHDTAVDVFNALLKAARALQTAVIIVTHDRSLAARCDRILTLSAGQLVDAHVD